ncbi:MAG: prepilin-type N-terminal cleavage/methylation domain-containing protein [Candidatus Gracilibacteria bacterium]|nr:prepilin-type N-terminal cleavage/methylation domain-containing protein [Candidatus Gracilibacteria bacterium]
MQKNNKAFTLVELIVVITILAILGTIAFINLQGYSVSARDGKRISDINNIMKKIGIETSKGTSISSLINTTKTNSGLTIDGNSGSSIQGTANFANLKEDGSKFKDPVTKGDYVFSYSVGGSGTGAYKFTQASTVNEEENTAVVKGNYYLMQSSDSPSITYNPDNTFFVVDGGEDLPYDIVEGGTPPPPVITLKTISDCGITAEVFYGTVDGLDTGLTCANDIIVCNGTTGSGYTISACNVGATVVGTGASSYGNYFQWGRNKSFAYDDITQQPSQILNTNYDKNNDGYGFVWSGSLSRNDWIVNQDDNLWGNTTDTPFGTNILARQGPCASGYHVPKDTEWSGVKTAGGWGTNGPSMRDKLKLPFAGFRDRSTGFLFGGRGRYWSSSTSTTYAYYLELYSTNIFPSFPYDRAYGFSVRCFKN